MSDHAICAPSSGDRWINCTMSLKLHKNSPSSVYAREGTVCHGLAAKALVEPGFLLSEQVDRVIDQIRITEELADATQEYVDIIQHQRLVCDEAEVKYKIQVEEKTWYDEDCYGTPDCALYIPAWQELHIYDLKMGKGVLVYAENNAQLRIYALAKLNDVMKRYKVDPLHKYYPKTVHLHISQPRITREETHRVEVLTLEEIAEWEEQYLARAILAYKTDKLYYGPTDKGCRWCSIRGSCKALASFSLAQAQLEFADLAKPAKSPDTNILTDEEISLVLKGLPILDLWKKAILAEAMDRMRLGKALPGYKMVEGRKNRIYSDLAEAEKLLEDLYGQDAFTRKLITPAQAEKKLGKKHEKAKDLWALITKPKGEPTLAPNTDKRPEIKLDATSQFAQYAT